MDWKKLFLNERGEVDPAPAADPKPGDPKPADKPAAVELSPAALEAIAKGQKENIAAAVAEALAAEGDDDGEPKVEPKEKPAETPSYLQPLVKPALDQAAAATFEARAAADATKFYARNPEAGAYMEQIEGQFDKLVREGRATYRQDIWQWMTGVGGALAETVKTDRAKATKDAEDKAKLAIVAGGGSARTVEPPKPVEEMEGGELEEFMSDKVF